MTPTVGRFWTWVALISVLLAGIVFGWTLHTWDNLRVTSVHVFPTRNVYVLYGGELWYVHYSAEHSAPIARRVLWTE